MLCRLSGAAAGGLRRSLYSSSRPPWALIQLTNLDKSGAPAPGATLHLDAPPFVTDLTVPAHVIHPRPLPDPATGVYGTVPGHVAATSSDGLLLLRFWETRFKFDAPAAGDDLQALASAIVNFSFTDMDASPEVTRFVCNPLSGEMYCLPDLDGTKRTTMYHHIGLLTNSEADHGPPDRYAVAEMFTIGGDEEEEEEGFVLRRFLSETGKWEKMAGLPSPLPAGRRMDIDSAVVPFGDRLWWVDESWGAVSVDPLSERPELRFVQLPRGSVLPDLSGVVLMRTLKRYRRMGGSERKMRYVEVSKEKPYVVSSFSLDDDGSSWTLDREVAFTTIWDDEHHEVPLKGIPAIGAIDPLNASVVYLVCGNQLLGVDMEKEKITGSSRLSIPNVPILPCVLPSWLESSQIPSADWSKNTAVKRETSPGTGKRETLHVEVELMK